MSSASLSQRLRDALAGDLEGRQGLDWRYSVRYSEVDGSPLGWGFDVEQPKRQPVSVWFDDLSQTCQLAVPAGFLRRGGVEMTWTDLSDEDRVIDGVRQALRDRLDPR